MIDNDELQDIQIGQIIQSTEATKALSKNTPFTLAWWMILSQNMSDCLEVANDVVRAEVF